MKWVVVLEDIREETCRKWRVHIIDNSYICTKNNPHTWNRKALGELDAPNEKNDELGKILKF